MISGYIRACLSQAALIVAHQCRTQVCLRLSPGDGSAPLEVVLQHSWSLGGSSISSLDEDEFEWLQEHANPAGGNFTSTYAASSPCSVCFMWHVHTVSPQHSIAQHSTAQHNTWGDLVKWRIAVLHATYATALIGSVTLACPRYLDCKVAMHTLVSSLLG